MPPILNDVHSQLNATTVAGIRRPESSDDLVEIISEAREKKWKISVAGGRHAMAASNSAPDPYMLT